MTADYSSEPSLPLERVPALPAASYQAAALEKQTYRHLDVHRHPDVMISVSSCLEQSRSSNEVPPFGAARSGFADEEPLPGALERP
jgi:hypothetical protein